ncbi:septum formation inhibitor Maf [Robertkochia aurantiaca]|uniref:septum formation inhibitor Maf n=1 Tax=Robertkochia aurantiaca TaxID=2873700 RepID=UPI001CCD5AE9|nr:septum formation inhibitor Maf [Robertkochia sp. 3YJGBD-33]
MKSLRYIFLSFIALALLILGYMYFSGKGIFAKPVKANRELPENFGSYWYQGEAEITSYHLEQMRYGEKREGRAVFIFVTEPFLKKEQVKANEASQKTLNVLKMNRTRKFQTGIYPYSVMTSVFSPVEKQNYPLKVSSSIQEWCGQVYMQLNNRLDYEVMLHSYFQGESDKDFLLKKMPLEDGIWNQIRLNPENLPTGELQMIPGFEYLRLSHNKIKSYQVKARLEKMKDFQRYTLDYPELERRLIIDFENDFPYEINQWTEEGKETYSDGDTAYVTRAKKIKRLKIDYWNKNRNQDLYLRDSLGL